MVCFLGEVFQGDGVVYVQNYSDGEREKSVTYYFLKAIKEGKSNISEIYEYVKPKVEDEAKLLNIQQIPSINPTPEKLTGKFYLRR